MCQHANKTGKTMDYENLFIPPIKDFKFAVDFFAHYYEFEKHNDDRKTRFVL